MKIVQIFMILAWNLAKNHDFGQKSVYFLASLSKQPFLAIFANLAILGIQAIRSWQHLDTFSLLCLPMVTYYVSYDVINVSNQLKQLKWLKITNISYF